MTFTKEVRGSELDGYRALVVLEASGRYFIRYARPNKTLGRAPYYCGTEEQAACLLESCPLTFEPTLREEEIIKVYEGSMP